MRDNEFLRSGYRQQQPTVWQCVFTGLFTMSNDFVNIYSHLIGFLVLLPITVYLLTVATTPEYFNLDLSAVLSSTSVNNSTFPCPSNVQKNNMSEIVPFAFLKSKGISSITCSTSNQKIEQQRQQEEEKQLQQQQRQEVREQKEEELKHLFWIHRLGMCPLLFAGLFCLLFSTTFHTFWVISPKVMNSLVKLDYLGISFLCVGHALSGTFYLYYCEPYAITKPFYVMLCSSFVITLPVTLHPFFSTSRARPARAATFGILGSLSFLPLVTKVLFYMRDFYDYMAATASLISIGFYGVGGVIYVSRFPECCRVGKHDKFFSSHQLMHMSVLLGIATHLIPLYSLFKIRILYGCQVPV